MSTDWGREEGAEEPIIPKECGGCGSVGVWERETEKVRAHTDHGRIVGYNTEEKEGEGGGTRVIRKQGTDRKQMGCR